MSRLAGVGMGLAAHLEAQQGGNARLVRCLTGGDALARQQRAEVEGGAPPPLVDVCIRTDGDRKVSGHVHVQQESIDGGATADYAD